MIPGFENLPDAPGVYFFRGAKKEILYIGKATSLKDRVKSYWSRDIVQTRGPKIVAMLERATSVDFTPTESVVEAVLLESKLIKEHQPPYNTREKDDKSFNCVVVTKEPFPRVLLYRGRSFLKNPPKEKIDTLFGPFPNAKILREALKIIRRLFPYRDTCIPNTGVPCFNRQIGLCPGVCTGEITKSRYQRQIANLKLFFEGRKSALLEKLEIEMRKAAKALAFEEANEIKKTIFALSHIQDVALIKGDFYQDRAESPAAPSFRIEAYDIAHLSSQNTVGSMVVIEDGEPNKSEYKKFKVKSTAGMGDIACLREILARRLQHREWRLPDLIVVDGSTAQRNAAMQCLKSANLDIPVVAVVKDDRHRPLKILGSQKFAKPYDREILLGNAESHRFAINYHRKLRGRRLGEHRGSPLRKTISL